MMISTATKEMIPEMASVIHRAFTSVALSRNFIPDFEDVEGAISFLEWVIEIITVNI